MRRTRTFTWLGAVMVVLGTACSSGDNGQPVASGGGGEALELYAFESLDDWVCGADHVGVVTVTDEREGEPVEDVEYTETDRFVTLRVDDLLWTRSDIPKWLDGLTGFEMHTWGWRQKNDGERYRTGAEHSVWPDVGKRYVMAFVWANYAEAWGLYTNSSVVPLDGSTLAPVPVSDGGDRAVYDAVNGLTVAELRQRLVAIQAEKVADPCPEVERY